MSTAATLKQNLSSFRSRVRIDEAEARRSGAAYLGAIVLGAMEKTREGDSPEAREPLIEKFPTLFGLPRTASIAIAAKVAAQYSSGDTADYLNGVADASAVIALHAFVKGEQVAGMGAARSSTRRLSDRERIRQLERRLAAKLEQGDEVDAELSGIEREVASASR
jgi:hypothetical protein